MRDVDVLAKTLIGESLAHDEDDAESIACSVLNRVRYPNWPDTVRGVCLQPKQFSCWNGGDDNFTRIMEAERGAGVQWYDDCWKIAERAVRGELHDVTRGSTHYHTPAVSPRWSRGKKPAHRTRGHLFFNNIDTPAPKSAAEALDQERPLKESRSVQGGVVAATATVAGGAYEAGKEALVEASTVMAPFKAYLSSDWIPWALTAAALGGVLWALWARYDDRRRGLR